MMLGLACATMVAVSCSPKKEAPKVLVLYYSQTGNTKLVAEEIASRLGADIEALVALPVREKIGRFKYVTEDDAENEYVSIGAQLAFELSELLNKED